MSGLKYGTTQVWNTAQVILAGTSQFTILPPQAADEVTIIIPQSGVSVDIISAGNPFDLTQFVTIDAPSGLVIPVSANTAEISVRRNDLSATPYTLRYMWRQFSR